MDRIIFALWFFWAAGLANLVPVLAAYIPGLSQFNAPLDGGRSWRGKRLLGDHKTWRGLISGTLLATAWFGVQMIMYSHSSYLRSITPFDMSALSALDIGFGLGFGALLGDAVGSFCKRQIGVAPGSSWFPFDQIDFIIGGIVCTLPFVHLPWINYLVIALTWVGVHLLFGVLGYATGFKDSPI